MEATNPVVIQQVATPAEASLLDKIQDAMPKTKFVSILPSDIPSWYKLKTETGSVMYTDKTGSFVLIGLVLDLKKGEILDNQLEGTSSDQLNNGETQ